MGRMTLIKALTLTAAALALTGLASAADTPDPFVGTWVLNIPKSTFDPGPPVKSHTLRIAKVKGGAYHDTVDLVEGDGSSTHIEFTAPLNGKFVPVTGSGYADSVSATQVTPRSFKYVLKKAGKRIETGTLTVAEDGKTLEGSLSGTDAGVAWKYHLISDRQS
jgi:hypothetical protein